MTDFKIRKGLSTDLFIDGDFNNGIVEGVVLENGSWYLCTDTAELFLGVLVEEKVALKQINGNSVVNRPVQTPSTGEGEADRSLIGAYIKEDTGELYFIFSDDTEESLGVVVGKDGQVTSVKIGETAYSHVDGVITLPNFATVQYVEAKLDDIVEPDLTVYAKKADVPTKVSQLTNDMNYLTSVPAEYVTETELLNKGYITDISGKADKGHKHKLSDITDYIAPVIPSLDGYATEDYVNNAIGDIVIPETDLSNYYTKKETDEAIAEAVLENIPPAVDLSGYALKSEVDVKANKVPFTTDKYVTKAFGDFTIGESVKGLSIAEILAKLLGLTDEKPDDTPEIPEIPGEGAAAEEIVNYIVKTQTTMYSQDGNGALTETPFANTTWTSEEASAQMDGVSTFYSIIDDDDVVIEAGYQEATEYNEEAWLTVALPSFITSFSVKQFDALRNDWFEVNFEMVAAEEQTIDGYTIWTVPDEYEEFSGSTYRFVIN